MEISKEWYRIYYINEVNVKFLVSYPIVYNIKINILPKHQKYDELIQYF